VAGGSGIPAEGPSRRAAPGKPSNPAAADLKEFDARMRQILRDYRMAGASLAIARDGKLLLARGYGLANVARKERLRPDHLLCIGSVTKPVTAVAILKLVDEGKLRLDARVVDVLKDFKPIGKVVDPRLRDVTVRQLLYHAGGWDASKSGQPPNSLRRLAKQLGVKGALTPAVCYRLALGRKLDFTPGTESHYSNWGFIVLRLVVEKVSGQGYEQYVKQKILKPMGITRMRMEPRKPQFAPGESRRYAAGGQKEVPGGADYPESAGNWIASAPDLARFLTALDGSRGKPFLSARMRAQMLAPPPPPYRKNGKRPGATDPHVGLGWDLARKVGTAWRYNKNGGRPGVLAWIEHLPGGVSWVVLFNTSPPKEGESGVKGHPLATARDKIPLAIRNVKVWPKRDLFPDY
jgi:CubicO group peptidase (beta-lactamase class C family)